MSRFVNNGQGPKVVNCAAYVGVADEQIAHIQKIQNNAT